MLAGERTAVVPREIFCVVDHLRRDLDVADEVRRGRFTHCGTTLDLGDRVDWLRSGRADDEEWRIEWVKLYEGLDLAHAFAITGDRSYLEAWEDLVAGFCAQVPVGHDSSDVSARRLLNWIYAWRRFAEAPSFTRLRAGLAERLVARIGLDAAHIGSHLTAERNHRSLELYALFVAALAFPELAPLGTSAEDALAELGRNLLQDVWPDGVHRECSTEYHLIVLRSFLGVVANAERFGLELPEGYRDRLGLACDFALHVRRPDGTTPSLSDGDVDDFTEVLTLAGDLLDRPDLTWAGTRGRAGRPPEQLDATFSVGGYVTQRSGWGASAGSDANERFLVLDCGPLGDGGHGHYDQLSVEIAAGERSIVVDPGRFTYADDPAGWRHWFKGTAAHNTVTVDGLDQVAYRSGKPRGPLPRARLVDRRSCASLDLITAEARSPRYGAVHTRRVAFVGRDYWIVHDRLRDDAPHLYEARWHLPPGGPRIDVVDDESALLVQTGAATLAIPSGTCEVVEEDGWVSPRYGVRLPAPIVTLRVNASRADLVTIVVPGATLLQARARVNPGDGSLTVGVVRSVGPCADRVRDELVWSSTETLLSVGHVRARGVALWRRSSASFDPRRDSWVVMT